MKKKCLFFVLVLFLFFLVFAAENNIRNRPAMPFPSLYIISDSHPFYMPRTQWHEGIVSLRGFSNYDDFNNVPVSIRGRGNSTWMLDAAVVKRPLRLRFDTPRPVMGSNAVAQDWILLANHFDPTLLRNYSAFYFTGQMNTAMHFVPMGKFIHLYINGEYVGLYLLADERDVNPQRMDLYWNEDPRLSDFFLHYCIRTPYTWGRTEGDHFVRVNGRSYDIRFPVSGSQRRAQADYIQEFLYNVSYAIRSRNFDDIIKIIDLDSFVDAFIVYDLFHNLSLHYSSTFFSIQGQGEYRRLYMGPVWDFDHGYTVDATVPIIYGSMYFRGNAYYNYWYINLMRIPEFRHALTTRWNELMEKGIQRQTITHMLHVANTNQNDFERNFKRHAVLGTGLPGMHPEQRNIDSFATQVTWFADWLETRIAWLDEYFNNELIRLFTAQLKITITNAELMYTNAVYSDSAYTVLYGQPFWSRGETILLASAINDAKKVLENEEITQSEIDEAAENLATVLAGFIDQAGIGVYRPAGWEHVDLGVWSGRRFRREDGTLAIGVYRVGESFDFSGWHIFDEGSQTNIAGRHIWDLAQVAEIQGNGWIIWDDYILYIMNGELATGLQFTASLPEWAYYHFFSAAAPYKLLGRLLPGWNMNPETYEVLYLLNNGTLKRNVTMEMPYIWNEEIKKIAVFDHDGVVSWSEITD